MGLDIRHDYREGVLISLVNKETEERTDKHKGEKNIKVFPDRQLLRKHINARLLKGVAWREMRKTITKQYTAAITVERHEIKGMWPKHFLDTGPRLPRKGTIEV